jgi:hypothetical protein
MTAGAPTEGMQSFNSERKSSWLSEWQKKKQLMVEMRDVEQKVDVSAS